MSPQVLELLILAGIAFFVVNKLISILGTTDESDPSRKGSAYGERVIKDITPATNEWAAGSKILEKNSFAEENLAVLVNPKNDEIIENLQEVVLRIEKFNPASFVKKAGIAYRAIIEALQKNDEVTLEGLIDPRYLAKLLDKKDQYKEVNIAEVPEIKIAAVTFFGNSVILTLQVKTQTSQEEWSFTRNPVHNDQTWFLSNID